MGEADGSRRQQADGGRRQQAEGGSRRQAEGGSRRQAEGSGRRLEAGDYRSAFALLAEMTQGFAAAADLQSALREALESMARHVGAEAGSLWSSDGRELRCLASIGPHPITGLRLPISEGIVGRSVRDNICQCVLDVASDPDFSHKMDDESGFLTRSILCAPLSFSDEVLGAVQLINKRSGDGRFDEDDAHLLQVLASSAALALSNARLAAARVENERVHRELELAAEIQRNLLPAPRPAPFPLFGVNVPARTVSGDFFDILPLAPDRIAFCLGDVSGKGMNAALLMAKTASLYRCLAREQESPGALLARLNDEICETATRGMFVTMAAGIYDAGTGAVRIANAGHEPPVFHAPDGSFEEVPAQAPPLGILTGSAFPEADLELSGGSLYLCSDGLTETACGDGGLLGSAGLRRLIERYAAKPLPERIQAIVADVGECELRDDLTLLGVTDEGRGR